MTAMDINDVRSLITVASLVAFLGIVVWAYSAKRRARFDEAARSVLDESDETVDAGKGRGERK